MPASLASTAAIRPIPSIVTRCSAGRPHHAFVEIDFAVVDEKLQFARLGEIRLDGEQRDGRQPVVTRTCHCRCGDR